MGGDATIRGIGVQLAVACELAIAVALDDELTALRVEGAEDIADIELRAGERVRRLVQVKSRAEHRLFGAAELAELVRRCAGAEADAYELITDAGVTRAARHALLDPAEDVADGRALTPAQQETLERLGLAEHLDVLTRFTVRPRWGDPEYMLTNAVAALIKALGEQEISYKEAQGRIEQLFLAVTEAGSRRQLARRTLEALDLRRMLGITTRASALDVPAVKGVKQRAERLPEPDPRLLPRAEVLQRPMQDLAAPDEPVVVLTGLPGCGKTESAIELADRLKHRYRVVWWLDAARETSVTDGLRALLSALGVADADMADDDEVRRRARQALEARQPALLVFDNVADPGALRRAGVAGGAQLLVTSRHPAWSAWGPVHEIPLFSEDEAVELLRRNRPRESRASAARLAEALGRLPLAVAQAGAHLAHSALPMDEFTDLLERRLAVLDSQQAATDAEGRYQRTVLAMLGLLLEGLDGRDARALLMLLAQFAPESVELDLIRRAAHETPEPYSVALRDEVRVEQALAQLSAAAVVRVGPDGPVVHRLTGRAARVQAGVTDDRRLGDAAVTATLDLFPEDALQTSAWPRAARLLPHAHSLLDRDDLLATEAGTALAERVCNLDHVQGRLDDAVRLARRTLGLLPPHSAESERAALLHIIGRAGLKGGRIPESVDRLVEALDTLARLGEEESLDYASIQVTLGAVLSELGMTDAREHLEHARAVFERKLPPDDKRIARVLIELAADVQAVDGDLRGAEKLELEALAIIDRPGADAGVDLARALGNLAGTLSESPERRDEALAVAHRALEVTKEVYGPEHPEVAYPLTTLGSLHSKHEPQRAFSLLLEALRLRLAAFDAHHEQVAYTLDHLGMALCDAGTPERAVTWLRQAHELLLDTFGEDHAEVAAAALDLGQVLADLGQREEARPLIVAAMEAIADLWGPQHPHVATARRVLDALDMPGEWPPPD